ncbi:hypothetical protein I2I11_13715 [Pontibacter sp. 172403-2]|uniref:hypothetical protein n=1 Tax=Pontibacter rufus TaxID=2791028 RepID=UPI0018AF5B40|nr:hypothetical protein [Pontibacter sp. 172403-2]MBF9254358.1 hypothetical protein [Pontibacter sp. 172403-2]
MGKIKIKFTSDGQDITEPPYFFNKVGKIQSLQRRYWTNKIEEIEIPGDNLLFEFDIDNIERDIDWGNQGYPSEIIKGKILEIIYYKEQSDKLDKILSEISSCTFDDRYNLDRLGNQAIEVINALNESRYFPDINFNKVNAIGRIHHTLNKEVEILTSYIKHKDSQRRKNEALSEAKRHLNSDINSFKISLEYFDVNKKEK